MSLSSLQLDAFVTVAQTLHFSEAARRLHITQSALSQRIRNLEAELSLTLFVRHRRGVQLTETGAQLLRYCQTRDSLETELLAQLRAPEKGGLAGMIRIGAYSSILRSAVVPSLGPLLRAHPRLRLQALSREMRELPEVLRRGEAEFILLDYRLERAGVEAVLLAHEEYLMTTSREHTPPPDLFLDHDPEDSTTERFLRRQASRPQRFSRSFLDEIYALMDGVAQGLGQAVIPRHLSGTDPRLKLVKGFKPYRVPVYLHYYAQSYYARVHQEVVRVLREGIPRRLM